MEIDKNDKLDLFIGPCMLETEKLVFETAEFLAKEFSDLENEVNIYFKGSFDKANRSAIDSKRGPGLEQGLDWMQKVATEFNLKTITDFHYPEQAEIVAKIVDVLQVPAFLCRQTDMIVAGAKACKEHNSILKVKKGQFLAPSDTKNIVEKAATYLERENIRLTERGTSFGYNNLVVDMSSFQIMKDFGVKTVHDATHCVQRPGGLGKTTGGKREQIFVLAKAAVAAGADGIFMEAHPDPDNAWSDASSQIQMHKAKDMIKKLLEIRSVL